MQNSEQPQQNNRLHLEFMIIIANERNHTGYAGAAPADSHTVETVLNTLSQKHKISITIMTLNAFLPNSRQYAAGVRLQLLMWLPEKYLSFCLYHSKIIHNFATQ